MSAAHIFSGKLMHYASCRGRLTTPNIVAVELCAAQVQVSTVIKTPQRFDIGVPEECEGFFKKKILYKC